jgi:GTPase SAR1 family protein
MLPNREVLMRLLKANTSFLIYGQKASGKTYLVHSLFKDSGVRFI